MDLEEIQGKSRELKLEVLRQKEIYHREVDLQLEIRQEVEAEIVEGKYYNHS